MNVEIGTEAAQFPEKEYTNGIFVAEYFSEASIPISPPFFLLPHSISPFSYFHPLLPPFHLSSVRLSCLS